MRGGSFSAAAFAFVIAALAWHFASPWWTLRDLQAAARARDADRIAAHVDFPALRDSLKSELAAALGTETAAGRANGEADLDPGALGAAIGLAMIDPVVDGLVSPGGLRLMFAAEGAATAPAAGFGGPEARIVRDGLSGFRVVTDGDGALVFRRQGYAWKLVAVDLPETRIAAR